MAKIGVHTTAGSTSSRRRPFHSAITGLTVLSCRRDGVQNWRRELPAGAQRYGSAGLATAADWLDRTVPVTKISDLTLEEWLAKFDELKRKNRGILAAGKPGRKRHGDAG